MDRAKGFIAFAGKGTDFKNLLAGFVHTALYHCSVGTYRGLVLQFYLGGLDPVGPESPLTGRAICRPSIPTATRGLCWSA